MTHFRFTTLGINPLHLYTRGKAFSELIILDNYGKLINFFLFDERKGKLTTTSNYVIKNSENYPDNPIISSILQLKNLEKVFKAWKFFGYISFMSYD